MSKTRTQQEIDSIFVLGVTLCPKCRGSRSISNEDGSYSPCQCVIKEMILKYIGDLKRNKTLTETPLLEPLKQDLDLVIEYDDPKTLYSHLKTALLYRKSWTKSWFIVTPDEVMSRSFSKEDEHRKELYKADLLIIMANAFPFYEAAGRQHEYVIKTRQALGKTTWFCTSNFNDLFDRTDLKSITTEFKRMMSILKKVRITRISSMKLVKEQPSMKEETRMDLGVSINTVNRSMLCLDDPVYRRITGAIV